MADVEPTLTDIEAAAARIRPYVSITPLVALGPDGPWLKAESLHATGAFKLRGAFNAILSLSPEKRRAGVVAHSSGNHAMAVAYAAMRLGVQATIVMPRDAPAPKLAGVRRYGCELVLVGPASAERAAVAESLSRDKGFVPILPYDAPQIVAATATIALEILDMLPSAAKIYAPVSGGGLIAGLALAAALKRPDLRVIGVEPAVAADALASLKAGRLVALPADQMAATSADGLRVQQLGDLNWSIFRRYVTDVVTVSEEEIAETIGLIAAEARLVAEPSGAVAAAGALKAGANGPSTVAILSGGNVEPAVLAAAVARRAHSLAA